MGLADTAELVVKLTLAGNFQQQLSANKRALGTFDAALSKTEGRAFRAGQQIGTGIKNSFKIATVAVAALGTQVIAGLGQLAKLEEATAQTNAVIKSTGGAAGISAEQVRKLAEQYENLNAIIDDKVIQSGENLLLTFTNIGKEAFQPALESALNLSTAMGQDLQTSIIQVGKALSDPIRGLTALRRVGVNFTKDQEKLIKKLVKSGDVLGAQKVILAELGKEFGGSFAAQGKTAAGAVAGIGDAVEDLQKALATALFPTIQKVLPKIRDFLTSPQLQADVTKLGQAIAGVFSEENIKAGTDILKSVFETAKAAAPVVAAAAKTMAGIVSTAVSVFKSLPPEIQALAVGAFAINKLTGGLVTNVAGGIAGSVISAIMKNMSAGVVNVNGAVVNVNGVPGGGGSPVGGPVGTVAGGLTAGAVGVAGIGAAIIGALQAGGAALAGEIAGPIGESIQKNLGGGPLNIFGPFERVLRALNGDLRSPLEQIEQHTLLVQHATDLLGGQVSQASVRNSERQEAIRSEVAAANASRIADSASERATITASGAASAATIAAATKVTSASEQASIARAAAAQTAATAKAGADTRSETAAVRRAVEAKKLSVTTNVNVQSKVSIANIIKQSNTYKSVYNVAQ